MSTKPIFKSLPDAGADAYLFPGLRQPFPGHLHDRAVLGCLLRGSRELRCGNTILALRAAQTIMIPAGMSHACKPISSECCWICLHMAESQGASLEIRSDAALFKQFQCLARLLRENAARASAQAAKLAAMAGELFKASASAEAAPCRHGADAFAQPPIGLERMAASANLSRFQLLRRHQRDFGITPGKCAQSLRLIKGQRLLRGGADIAVCALESGYCDQSHFSRAFKRILGVTPGDCRKAWLAEAAR